MCLFTIINELLENIGISRPNDNVPSQKGPRTNSEIRVPEVRLISETGEQLGVVPTRDAIARAAEAKLDLVEVSPNAEPPVCKILDYGKYKYQLQKKKTEAKKKQKVIHLKEIKLRPNIGEHDYQVKIKAAKKFLEQGDKVKFSLRFKGREMAHRDIGNELLQRFIVELEEIAKLELRPKYEGRQMIMILVPLAS
ncbi:MAG: translation initiation factor IF-3 [Alphaproteobacteria bacterium]|nr:translation initiation factor IF-3 [Alphaproteobacteria bacterium]